MVLVRSNGCQAVEADATAQRRQGANPHPAIGSRFLRRQVAGGFADQSGEGAADTPEIPGPEL
jgi:hypothetical protein